MEGINAPQALFGVFSQTMPAGGPPPAGFLTTQNSFLDRHRESCELQSGEFERGLHSAEQPWPYIQNWFLSVQREIAKDTVIEFAYNGNHSLSICRSSPITTRQRRIVAGQSLALYQQRAPVPTFGPITWVDPAGDNHYNGLSARVEHRLAARLVLPEFVHLGQGDGRFRAGAGILRRLLWKPIRRTFTTWRPKQGLPAST